MKSLKTSLFCLLLLIGSVSVMAQLPAITDSAEAQVGISDTTTTEEEELLYVDEPAEMYSQPDVVLQQYVYQGNFDWATLSDSLQARYEYLPTFYHLWKEFFFPFQGYVFLAELSNVDLFDMLLKLLPMVLLLLYVRKYLRKVRTRWGASATDASLTYSFVNLERDLFWGLWLLVFGVFFSSPYLLLPGTLLSLWKGARWLQLYKHQQKNSDDRQSA